MFTVFLASGSDACPAGTYRDDTSSSDCIDCAAGKSSGVGSTGQSACTTPGWLLGDVEKSCSMVCATAGHACTSGDWDVSDRASLEAALVEAGFSIGDQASMCAGGYTVEFTWPGNPSVWPQGSICEAAGAATSCSTQGEGMRRLCRCV